MQSRTLEYLIAASLVLVGIYLLVYGTLAYTKLPPFTVISLSVIAGLVAVISAIAILWDAVKSG